MEFPAYELKPLPVTDQLADALGARPEGVYIGRDLLCIFKHEETVRNLSPDQQKLLALDGLGVQVTAPGKEFDCASIFKAATERWLICRTLKVMDTFYFSFSIFPLPSILTHSFI